MLRRAPVPSACTVQVKAPRRTLIIRGATPAHARFSVSVLSKSNTPRRYYGGGHDDHKPVRKPGVRYFTRADVAEHNFVDDAWIVIHGHVYNITPWVPSHPGGNIILSRAGKDATDIFERIGHSDYAQSRLKDFYIGEVEGAKRHDNIGDGLPWYYQSQIGLEAYRDHHPRPFNFAQETEAEQEENLLQGPPLGPASQPQGSREASKKV